MPLSKACAGACQPASDSLAPAFDQHFAALLALPLLPLRALQSALLVVAAALTLSACGGGGDADADDGPAGNHTVTDARGVKVKAPNYPQRVVTLGEPMLDGALALGLRPIAIAGSNGASGLATYLHKAARGMTNVGARGTLNLSHIAALDPDLILIDDTATQRAAVLDQLRRVAPTVSVAQAGANWRAAFVAEAAALNRSKEGTHVLQEFDARVTQVRAALGKNAGARISVVRWSDAGVPSPLTAMPAAAGVLSELALKPSASLGGDWLLVDAPTPKRARELPGATKFKAVRTNHAATIDGSAWTSAGGPIAERIVLDDIARALTR